jgi:carboxypeptidase PM20D1
MGHRGKAGTVKKVFGGTALLVAALGGVMLYNTLTFTSRQQAAAPAPAEAVDAETAAAKLADAVRFKTVSHTDPAGFDRQEFLAFHRFLEKSFPRVHQRLKLETVSELSLLYTWEGSEPGLPPALLLAHMDVVPIAPGTEAGWSHPPFEGAIADGFVWGRGTLDDKGSLIGILEAVETLIAQGFRPRRTTYLAFGHDEEVGGINGAARIAGELARRGVKALYALDESGIVAKGIIPGVAQPVCLVGVAEKGYMTLELSVRTEGGHSSMPPSETAIGILGRAVGRLEQNPFPTRMDGPGMMIFDWVGPEMNFGMKLLFANRWLLGGLLRSELLKTPSMAAVLRTTTAPTVFQAGNKENVLPQEAKALVNFRLLPGDSVEAVTEQVRAAVGDPRVRVENPRPETALAATAVTSPQTEGFKLLERTIRQSFPQTVVAPYLVLGGTDARHYAAVSASVLRFLPLEMTSADLGRLHGTDERVEVAGFARAVGFYIRMIKNSNPP